MLSGCADNPFLDYQGRADQLAARHGWRKLNLGTPDFGILAYARLPRPDAALTVYIEGDGDGWLNARRAEEIKSLVFGFDA